MNLHDFATYHCARLSADENSYFALIEAPHEIVPFLAAAFRGEADPRNRSAILKTIWQHRLPSTIPLLQEGLHDSAPEVWKEALDGLVTIGGPECISIIESAARRQSPCESDRREFIGFLDEALDQLADECGGSV